MFQLFKISIFACLFTISISVQGVKKSQDVVSENCHQVITNDLEKCEQKTQDKWNSTQITIDAAKYTCCSKWDDLDCYENLVKNHCNESDYLALYNYIPSIINDGKNNICHEYRYYSSKCIISENEIKNGTSEEEKAKLITEIPKQASKICQDQVDASADTCKEKVTKESGYNKGTDFKSTKINCCLNYKVIDCKLDVAKENRNCTHQDVIAIAHIHDQYKANMTGMIGMDCSRYPPGSEQCKNHSPKLETFTTLILLIIVIQALFLK